MTVNRTKQLGNRVVRIADLIVELRSLIQQTFDVGQHQFDGSDYTMLEANFGLPAGTGANFLYLLGLLRGVFLTTDTIAGADRKAWLDEFIARLSGQ